MLQTSNKLSSNHNQKTRHVLRKLGFTSEKKLATTLQGSIWRVTYPQVNVSDTTPETAIVKVTNKSLHKNSSAIVEGTTHKVQEDILKEQSILKYLSDTKNLPKSIVKWKHFAVSHSNFYFVMEDAGSALFNFIQNAHQFIKLGQIKISHWQYVVKVILKQMIECIEYIHLHKICHNDVSVENFLINDVDIEVTNLSNNKVNIQFMVENIQVKICDFGLAEMFENDKCKSDKHCGKKGYKSPEVVEKKPGFDARQNDVWCLGIVAFIMTLGHPPFACANIRTDEGFKCIMNGYLCDVLKTWNVLHYFNEELISLFQSLFKYEKDRITLNEIKQHLYGVSS